MRKLAAVAVSLFFVLTITSFAYAVDGENTSTPTPKPLKQFNQEIKDKKIEVRSEIKENIEQKKDALKEREASKLAQLKEKRLELVNKRFTYISRHLNAYLSRLDKIAAKIAARIEKLKGRGVDTSKAQAKLDESVALKAAAKAAIDQAIIDAQSVTGAPDVKAATETASASVKAAKDALWAYHKKLVEAIRELKSSRELREGTGSPEID